MVDIPIESPSHDNVPRLFGLLGIEIDQRLVQLRQGTPYEKARPSDGRVFVAATRGYFTLSQIAEALGISRQAVHLSAQRLVELGVVMLEAAATDRREKMVVLTEAGRAAAKMATAHVNQIETEIAQLIGSDGLEALRATLKTLWQHAKSNNAAGNGIKPPA